MYTFYFQNFPTDTECGFFHVGSLKEGGALRTSQPSCWRNLVYYARNKYVFDIILLVEQSAFTKHISIAIV